MRINKYPGACQRCGVTVKASAGALVAAPGGGWAVEHVGDCPVPQGPVLAPGATVGDLGGILGLFESARKHLKYPAIVLSVPALDAGLPPTAAVHLIRLNPHQTKPGTITVTDGNRNPDGSRRTWLGRIEPDGTYKPSAEAIDSLAVPDIFARLQAFAQAPAQIAGEHGRLTGRCCFCHIALTDARSTAVGYGPTCADHYGLPWGDKPAEFAGRAA